MVFDSGTLPLKLQEKLRKIFEACKLQSGHQNLVEKTKKLYTQVNNVDAFLEEFIAVLKYSLVYADKGAADKMLSYVSKFTVSLYSSGAFVEDDDSNFENEQPFVNGLLNFLAKAHWATFVDARVRCITLINSILTALPEDSFIPIDMWTILTETICSRLQDRNTNVRVAAVLVARKLQEPKDPQCKIMKLLLFHICDPAPAVRRAVISSIALTRDTIVHVLARTLDVNENVRRNAFVVVARVRFQSLPIAHRVTFLERGLKDRAERVRTCVENVMIDQWLEHVNQDILKFIEALDAVNCPEVASMVVKAILKTKPVDEILKNLPLDEETHIIPSEQLTPESSLLWRCLAEHCIKNQLEEELESVLPNLTVFCDYVERLNPGEENQEISSQSNDEQWALLKQKRVLLHLLELAMLFDLRDEMGRMKLRKLTEKLLTNLQLTTQATECLLSILHRVIPDQNEFIASTIEVISEIREPLVQTNVDQSSQEKTIEKQLKISGLKVELNDLKEKEYEAVQNKNYMEAANLKSQIEHLGKQIELELCLEPETKLCEIREEKTDPETWCKCLTILINLVRISRVTSFTPPLRSLKEDFVNKCLRSDDLLTQSLAIQALAQFCILDKATAQDNILGFLFMLSENGDNELNIPALKAVFDIFQTYGIESFENLDESRSEDPTFANEKNDEEVQEHDKSKCGAKFISVLKELLNCTSNDELKKTAFEGFCKLLATGVIYSPSLLKNIIIKGFSPIRGNECEDRIRQLFMVFFPLFARKTPRSQEMIESAFIPVMRALNDAQLGTPEAEISPKDVSTFLMDNTRPGINSSTSSTVHVHNALGLLICLEILRDANVELRFDQNYLRSLSHLHLCLDSEAYKQQLLTLITKITKLVTDNANKKLIKQFRTKIMELGSLDAASIQNTLRTTQESSGPPSIINSINSSAASAPDKDAERPQASRLDSVAEIEEESFIESSPKQTNRGVIAESSDSDCVEQLSDDSTIVRSPKERRL